MAGGGGARKKGNIVLKSKLWMAAAAAGALMATSMPALAGDGAVDEVRLGLYDHNTNLFATRHETSNPDINGEVLFKTPSFLEWAWAPRPIVGANVNTGGGTSIAYAGLAWDYDFTEALFVEGSFGGAIHNGHTSGPTNGRDRINYGCRVMFHESASLGYRLTSSTSVMLTVDHMSNASLCDPNPGLTDAGVRIGYSF
jgi:lipid A 3-O-deacylase